MLKIINNLKKETNNNPHIIYETKKIFYKKIYIIYNETITDSLYISNFIIRSLTKVYVPTYKNIINKIYNYKYKEINNEKEINNYINNGYTILLIKKNKYIALETKKNLSRSISNPTTENTQRGSLDSFTENIETNIGLIKRRIKTNNLWQEDYIIGKYTSTNICILFIKDLINNTSLEEIKKRINNININGLISSGTLKNLIEKENKYIFPTIQSTEKPYTAAKYLLTGHIIIIVDNDPFILILPTDINDNFISEEDDNNKYIHVTFIRIIRYITFIITLITPGIFLALTTYNQEVIPLNLLTSIAAQRESVPFSAFTECLFMIIAFEILRESDLKKPSFASSALSIVGALILGEAAVNAGIVSPIMIIIVAITAISSLIFNEPNFSNALRLYRFLFMIGASILGLYGILLVFIILLINLSDYNFLNKSYLSPFTPINKQELKNSIIKYPEKETIGEQYEN